MTENTEYSEADVVGYECKHAVYTQSQINSNDDMLTVKENIHLKDGRIIPTIRRVKNFPRDFYVTKEGFRDHKDKKEFERISRLQKFTCTQRTLLKTIARALGRGAIQGGLRIAARSPYLYGCDITTPTLIKQRYMAKYPDCVSDNTVAVMDIESDTIRLKDDPGYGRPIIVSATFRDKAIMAVDRRFVKGIADPDTAIRECAKRLIGGVMEERKIQLEIVLVNSIAEGICACFKRLHEWKPDFLTFWNINYDMPEIIKLLQAEGLNPADVFCDPSVPVEFRYFDYREGSPMKVTASGKEFPLGPAERWHVVTCPASFIFIDSMCVYQKIRIAAGKEPSYSLAAILHKHNLGSKLMIEQAKHLSGLPWHRFMQEHHPIEYCVYNLVDDIKVEQLDEQTLDLKQQISSLSGVSEYAKFSSNPRRLCDDLHFFGLKNNLVIATTSDHMTDELDELTISLGGWISTLQSAMMADNGIKCIVECPTLSSRIYAHCADLDISTTYPTEEEIMNISKETTKRELCAIRGISEDVRRTQGINLSGGHTNAVEFCVECFGAPSFDKLLEAFEAAPQ